MKSPNEPQGSNSNVFPIETRADTSAHTPSPDSYRQMCH